ncbi:MAG TPA: DUF433 domain-containing protein [Gemmataceae bacterium]|nr:DUF433 domain-containing protein [Gemmataceae bacterium]
MRPTETAHIFLDDQGRAVIDDTRMKVIQVAIDHTAWLWSPEAIQRQYPYLSLAQIYAALAYYYEHKAEIDAEIERQEREYEELRAKNLDSPGRQKLRALGKIP